MSNPMKTSAFGVIAYDSSGTRHDGRLARPTFMPKARCGCGWNGRRRLNFQRAVDDLIGHIEKVQ